LRHIASNQANFKALFLQALKKRSADIASIGKNHHAINAIAAQNILQQGKLFAGGGDKYFLFDGICRHTLWRHFNHHWLVGPLLGETQHFWGECRREQQRLAIFTGRR